MIFELIINIAVFVLVLFIVIPGLVIGALLMLGVTNQRYHQDDRDMKHAKNQAVVGRS